MSHTCDNNEFKCADGSACISSLSRCDGYKDCYDNSDEIYCSPHTVTPPSVPQPFFCDSGDTIDSQKHCDGNFDCPDASDELDCPTGLFHGGLTQ